MASIALQPTTCPPDRRPPSRPALRVLEGGRSPAAQARQAVYRRRRMVAGLLAVTVVALIVLAGAALAGIAGGVPSAAGSSAPPPPSTPSSCAGDTLSSIAEAVAPGVDPRSPSIGWSSATVERRPWSSVRSCRSPRGGPEIGR